MALVLVDTSVWIDLLGKHPSVRLDPDRLLKVATCPPVLQEVLQGVRNETAFHSIQGGLLALPCLESEVRTETYLKAAEIYRLGRKNGFTIRSSTDCLIAAIAIAHRVPVMHRDRDFKTIAKYTKLQVGNL